MIHRTSPSHASVHPSGWFPLDATTEISRLPLVDRQHRGASGEPLFARLDYADAVTWCQLHGCDLPTAAQLDAARLAGLTLRPVTLWTPEVGTPQDLEAAERHDALVWAQLRGLGWAHGVPVAGAGKHWVRGAPAGRAWLMGWHVANVEAYGSSRRGPGWVQPAPEAGQRGAHGDDHVDYSSTTVVVRRRGAVDPTGDTEPPGWLDAAERETLAALRPTAAAVRATVARLLEEGGHVLPSTAVEPAAGHVLAASGEIAPPLALQGPGRLPASLAPHGYRCSVAEQIADARILGTWHDVSSGYVPRVGDLACSRRAGGDPRTGGLGHVERVPRIVNRADGGAVWSIGGNENDGYVEAPLDLRNVIGWIEYPPALGARCGELARLELAAGVRERPGAASHPRIQAYHAGARRGGGPRAGMPGAEQEGVAVLGERASDSVAWCASSTSWCCAIALLE